MIQQECLEIFKIKYSMLTSHTIYYFDKGKPFCIIIIIFLQNHIQAKIFFLYSEIQIKSLLFLKQQQKKCYESSDLEKCSYLHFKPL